MMLDGGDRVTPGKVMLDGVRCITPCGVVLDSARRITSLEAVLHSFRRHIRPEGGTRRWAAAQWLLGAAPGEKPRRPAGVAVKWCHALRPVRRATSGGLCPSQLAPGACRGLLTARSARRGVGGRPGGRGPRAWAHPVEGGADAVPGSTSPSPGMPDALRSPPVGAPSALLLGCACGPCPVFRSGRISAVAGGGVGRGADRLRGTPDPRAPRVAALVVSQARWLRRGARRGCQEARWSRRAWRGLESARAVGT